MTRYGCVSCRKPPHGAMEGLQMTDSPPPPTPVPPGYELKKVGHRGRNLGIGCLGLIVLIVIIAIASNAGKNPTTTSSPAAGDNGTRPSAAAAAPTTVLLDLTGSGTKTTQKFNAAGDWDLTWTYDCSAFGQQGNFQVF